MKQIVVFGAGDIAELARFYFEHDTERHVAAFTVDAAFLKESSFCGLPVVALEELRGTHPPSDYDVFVAVSYQKMNTLRETKMGALRTQGYRLASYVSRKASVFTDQIGDNCFILEDNTVQPFVQIGNGVTLWSGNHIGHHSTIEDYVFISSHVVISGGVTVGRNSFLGVNATVGDHVKLAPFTLLGAGALILDNTEPEGVYISNAKAEHRKVKSTRLPRI